MIEKRKYVRLHASIDLIYKIVKKHKRSFSTPSSVKNLSGGGIRMMVKEDMREGDLLKIQIQVPHLAHAIEGIGEVVWFQDHEAGIRFRDMEAKDLHRVLEYVHSVGIG